MHLVQVLPNALYWRGLPLFYVCVLCVLTFHRTSAHTWASTSYCRCAQLGQNQILQPALQIVADRILIT